MTVYHYLKILRIRQYVVCIRWVRNGTLLHQFIPTRLNIIHVCLSNIWLYLICTLEGLKPLITPEFHSYVNLEVSCLFRKFPTSFWSLVNVPNFYIIYVLVRFNCISMVVTGPYNGLAWRFLTIFNMLIISYEPLFNRYTWTYDLWVIIISSKEDIY